MKAYILYFSGTGNTAYVANKISGIMQELQVATEVHSMEDKIQIQKDSFDMLILGCPKYYEYPVLDFIKYLKKNLPTAAKKIPVMFFCTQASPLKTDFRKIEKMLSRKNYQLTVSRSIPLANNMVIMDMFPVTAEEKKSFNLKQLDKELRPLVTDFLSGIEHKEEPQFIMRLVGHISAVLCTWLFSLLAVKYSPSADCTGCSLCSKKCPKKNIKMVNGRPRFCKQCIFCMRCINICPSNAILYNKKKRSQYKSIK